MQFGQVPSWSFTDSVTSRSTGVAKVTVSFVCQNLSHILQITKLKPSNQPTLQNNMKIFYTTFTLSFAMALAQEDTFPEPVSGNFTRNSQLRGHGVQQENDRHLTTVLKNTVNYRVDFYGDDPWKLGDIRYDSAGGKFSQTKEEYNTAKTACDKDPDCYTSYTGAASTGNKLGKYGYHCGDGHGNSDETKILSGVDYCCMRHDRNVWNVDSDDTVSTVQGICGMYACLMCSTGPRADYGLLEGGAVIAAWEALAIGTLCTENGLLSGFTCHRDKLENGYGCSSNDQCMSEFCHFGQCKAKFSNGHACLSDGVCQSGFCHWGKCQDKLPNNYACLSNRVCASNNCQYIFPYFRCV